MDPSDSPLFDLKTLHAREISSSTSQPPVYKVIGITLAITSGVFIGTSFVLKKKGLLKANAKYNEEAGEGYGYLKNAWWWTGMTLMIIGEIFNFVAYAFVDAILVTPMGALSVVVTTVLSAIFLKERLSFIGKVGCFNCIVGATIIALNAPQQSSVSDIQQMKDYVITPGFLSYAGVVVVGSIIVAVWVAPLYAKKSMFVYLSICSFVGGLSVVATQGLGAAILAQIRGTSQFNQWFLYVLLVFVIGSLLTEIIYLNKALNIFNAALVTPTYYVFFTSATIITSAILFQGFKGSVIAIITLVMGFLVICTGVVLLQLSKSAKDVPDTAVFKGDLDQIREVAEQEQPESEPKADAIRGTAAIIRRISMSRQKMEEEEAKRYFREKQEDESNPPGENEVIQWDGLRRRRTIIGNGPTTLPLTPRSARSPRPPLGMSRFPDEEEEQPMRTPSGKGRRSFLDGVRSRASTMLHPHWQPDDGSQIQSPMHPVALTEIAVGQSHQSNDVDTTYHGPGGVSQGGLQPPFQGRQRSDTPRSIIWADESGHDGPPPSRSSSLAPPEPPPHTTRRQFSFQSMFNRMRSTDASPRSPASPGKGILKRSDRSPSHDQRHAVKNATEEERLGLVKGDSRQDGLDEFDEKLQRAESPDSLDSVEEDHLEEVRQHFVPRPHQASTASSVSTTAFPPYEDFPPHQAAHSNLYLPHRPSVRRVPSSEQDAAGQWHRPPPVAPLFTTSSTPSSQANPAYTHPYPHPHSHAPIDPASLHSARLPHGRTGFTSRANSLPPIPAEDPADSPVDGSLGTIEPYVQVDLRSPTHNHSSPELGVQSLSSSTVSIAASPPHSSAGVRAQQRRGRHDRRNRGDSNGSGGNSIPGSRSRSGSSEDERADPSESLVRRGAFI